MKNRYYSIIASFILITFYACEKVVDVPLETAQERLVIEALIAWENGTIGNEQTIKLTKTASYYTNDIVYATGATVTIIDTNTTATFSFTETTPGIYTTSTFVPIVGDNYRLTIAYNGSQYVGEETLLATPAISVVDQSTADGFSTTDPEVNVYFQDDANENNYYHIDLSQTRPSSGDEINNDYYNYSDEFENGNILHFFYENEDIIMNDTFDISLYSISTRFYHFLQLLDVQANSNAGPFSSPPANVKGNCNNITNEDLYPYGYFALFEKQNTTYTFQ